MPERARSRDGRFAPGLRAEPTAPALQHRSGDHPSPQARQAVEDIGIVLDQLPGMQSGPPDRQEAIDKLHAVLDLLMSYPEGDVRGARGRHLLSPVIGHLRLHHADKSVASPTWVEYATKSLTETRDLLNLGPEKITAKQAERDVAPS